MQLMTYCICVGIYVSLYTCEYLYMYCTSLSVCTCVHLYPNSHDVCPSIDGKDESVHIMNFSLSP